MLERARQAAAAMGIANAEFRRGDIAAIPLEEEAKKLGWSDEAIQTAMDIADRTREIASLPS